MQLRVNLLLWLLLLLLLFAVVIRSARDARTDTVLRHASFAGAPQPAPRFAHTSMPLNAALFIVLPAHTQTHTDGVDVAMPSGLASARARAHACNAC